MFKLNGDDARGSYADPLAYERAILTPQRPRMSEEIRSPDRYEIARLNGKPVSIPYAAAKAPSGKLKQVQMLVGGIPILNTSYQGGEIAVFLIEVADALIEAGIAKEI